MIDVGLACCYIWGKQEEFIMVFMIAHMDIRNVPDDQLFAVAHCIAADLCWGSGVAPIINREMFDAESKCRYKCSTNPDGVALQLKVGEILPVVTEKPRKPSGSPARARKTPDRAFVIASEDCGESHL